VFKLDKIPLKSAKGLRNPSPKRMLLFYDSRLLTKYPFDLHGAGKEGHQISILKNYIVLGNVVYSQPGLTLPEIYISSAFLLEVQEVSK